MFRPGTLTGPDAARLNEMLRRLEQLDRASGSGPLSTSRAGGIPQFTAAHDRPVILAEITADDGGVPPVHEAKRKTRAAESYSGTVVNDVVDYSPETLFDKVLSVNETAIAAGALVHLSPVIDHPGYWWAIEAGAAAPELPRVRVATTASGTLASAYENGDTVDGVVLATGDRILIKDQSTGAERGVYTVNASGAPTRAADADAEDDVVGMLLTVSEGTANADTIWLCTTDATWTPGTHSSTWVKVYPAPGAGWYARLTTASGGAWKWVKLVISAGAWADSGSESASYNAYPSGVDAGLTCLPHAGQRVWMTESPAAAGSYEFHVVLSPPLLGEVTTSAASHTIKQLTYSGGIADVSGPVSYTGCRSATGSTIAVGEKVLAWKIPDVSGEHWILPVSPPTVLTYGSGSGYDTYTVSTTTAYANVLVTAAAAAPLVLPGHGTYRMHLTCKMRFTMPDPSYGGSANIGTFRLRWRNNTNTTNYTDYFAASSQLTTDVLDPGGAPNDTVWEFCVSMTDDLTVSAGTDAAKDFHLQADFAQSGGSGTGVISELRVSYLQLA